MAQTGIESARALPAAPRFERLAQLAPIRTLLAIALLEMALYVAFVLGFSQLPGAVTHGAPPRGYLLWFPEIVLGPLIGFALVFPPYSLRRAREDLERLRPALRCDPRELDAIARGLDVRRSPLVLAAIGAGAVAGVALTFSPIVWAGGAPPGFDHPDQWWGLLRNPLLMAGVTRVAVFELELTRRFSRAASERAVIDLLDLEPLAPLVNRGLRDVLWLALLTAFSSPLAMAPWPADAWLGFMPLVAAVAVTVLVLPVRGVRARIRDAKHAELERVRARIREERDAVLAGEGGETGRGRLADLLAYEARVEAVREWPFDAPALLRFTLYLAIPVGSWLGGALVERLVDALLG